MYAASCFRPGIYELISTLSRTIFYVLPVSSSCTAICELIFRRFSLLFFYRHLLVWFLFYRLGRGCLTRPLGQARQPSGWMVLLLSGAT
jgi:hypothetical protein